MNEGDGPGGLLLHCSVFCRLRAAKVDEHDMSMCGIAGIIGRIGDPNRAALQRMSDAMVHRGPDGQGTWESPPDAGGFGAMLTHRRLAILDVSPAGAQPMTDPVSGQVIVFNGEIYNFQELRDRLVASGQEFPSTRDTAGITPGLAVTAPAAATPLTGRVHHLPM